MAELSYHSGDLYVTGTLTPVRLTVPAGTIVDAAVGATAALADTKLVHRYNLSVQQTGTVVAQTQYLRICRAAGNIRSVEAAITEAIATGADRTVTIDVQKSTGAAAFATVLSATIVFTNVSVLRTVSVGTIASAALVDNDILKVTVAVAGAAGAQATGLIVTVTIGEDPQ